MRDGKLWWTDDFERTFWLRRAWRRVAIPSEHANIAGVVRGRVIAQRLRQGYCHPASKAPTSTSSAAVTPNDNPLAKANSQRVLDDAVNATTPGCSAAVGSKGTVVWTGVRGIADTATGDKITLTPCSISARCPSSSPPPPPCCSLMPES